MLAAPVKIAESGAILKITRTIACLWILTV